MKKEEERVDVLGQQLTTVVLHIPSLRCGGCLKRVTEALRALPGLEVLTAALPTRTVILRYARQQLEPERIIEAVRACGHVPGELREADHVEGE
ncbi:MAG: heavy-metal-associated domain-containing protein [Thermogemmatispora sp.]|uniref:heavy-metal-associated domain-containing protein n=1 Tax=Thermogemmatispora sp. TaxID=1968838 RepID=UPI00263004FE|nr:heavy-metal-associated domain-containing protein [Thermogemmatispora sp.]MBX5457437.1 heavy-metal-associated domain-containing protein [Thermogemmatispora sp.]